MRATSRVSSVAIATPTARKLAKRTAQTRTSRSTGPAAAGASYVLSSTPATTNQPAPVLTAPSRHAAAKTAGACRRRSASKSWVAIAPAPVPSSAKPIRR